jgi:hypothetical protein
MTDRAPVGRVLERRFIRGATMNVGTDIVKLAIAASTAPQL